MDRFRCQTKYLPANLYRVQYDGCQTSYFETGLEARDTSTFYSESELESFRQSLTNQFTWGWRGSQPYITVFSDKEHAENWGLKEPWNRSGCHTSNWEIITIDT